MYIYIYELLFFKLPQTHSTVRKESRELIGVNCLYLQETSLGNRNLKGQGLTSGSSNRLPVRKQLMESASFAESKSTETSASISMDDFGVPSSSRAAEVSPRQLYHGFLSVFYSSIM